ncbi:MAG: V-type ATP synthase subunit E [Sedimentisphaerales bacterium]|nr:V-type ATP synthase subunit E [Sedimentisphaerales bacterium]
METENVIEKILSDAKAKARDIAAEADKKINAEKAQSDLELTEFEKQTQTLAIEAADAEKAHILAAARMRIAKEYLTQKSAILEQVFDRAKQKLQNLSDDDYKKLMTKLMLEAVETGDEEVIVDKNEKRIDVDFIKEVNRQLAPGYAGNLRLAAEKRNTEGGFILKRGKIKTNVSIDVLIGQARKELEIELAKEIFA